MSQNAAPGAGGTSAAPPNMLAMARETLLGLLNAHDQQKGIGPDAYHAKPMAHPMAEGRFLSALASAARAKVLTHDRARVMAIPSLARLERQKLAFGGGSTWGLNFSWKEAQADEPFLITTGIIAQGLCDLATLLPDLTQAEDLRGRALAALAGWADTACLPHPELSCDLPAYSPVMRKPVVNAAAFAAAVLCRAGRDPSGVNKARLLRIREHHLPGIGWHYAPQTPVVDLLHQCYILAALETGLAEAPENRRFCSRVLVETVAAFSAHPGDFFDTAEHLTSTLALPPHPRTILRFTPSGPLQLKPNPARLWSLGELLAVMAGSIASQEEDGTAGWRPYAMPVCGAILARLSETEGEALFPRHLMHAAWGLARFLEAVRAQRHTKPVATAG